MAYKIRVVLDTEQDVFRDIIVDESINLEDLHFAIAKAFGFGGQEMASFYMSDDSWEQGVEIPLFNMSDDERALSMATCDMVHALKEEGDKMIYVYDFFSMWTFYVELSEIFETDDELPMIALSFGNVPEEAPEKTFTAEDNLDDMDLFDGDSGFDNIDDLDLDNF